MPKLTELAPRFVGYGGEGVSDADGFAIPERTGVGLGFDCPCGKCGQRVYLGFRNPIDGKEQVNPDLASWQRTGEDFETMTLTPSILRKGGCGWHGFLTNGELKSC